MEQISSDIMKKELGACACLHPLHVILIESLLRT